MYCWGSCSNGELGLGGIEEQIVTEPRHSIFDKSNQVTNICSGVNHTVFILQDGSVYTCGANDLGQLGHDKPCTRPGKVDALSNQVIKSASCGSSFTIAINEWGQLFAWGSNSNGKLGVGKAEPGRSYIPLPRMIKSIGTLNVIQVSCGYDHSLALTASGMLYAWGINSHGQLGVLSHDNFSDRPRVVTALSNIPLRHISAGGNHSFAISVSGSVFGWGRNHVGQLGIEDRSDKTTPTPLKFLHRQKICKICCGEDHCVGLTIDGRIFTWGAGTYGQLGHNISNNEFLPRQVIELMGSFVIQIACGRCHSLAYVPSASRIHSFGLGGSGQLGNGSVRNALSPVVVHGRWSKKRSHESLNKNESYSPVFVSKIFSGGAQNFVLTSDKKDEFDCSYSYVPTTENQIRCLNSGTIDVWINFPETSQIPDGILNDIEVIFSSGACLNSSYLNPNEHFICDNKNHGLNLPLVRREFEKLSAQVKNPRIIELIGCCIEKLLDKMTVIDVESLRIFMLLPNCHLFMMPELYSDTIIDSLAGVLLNLSYEYRMILGSWWALSGGAIFLRLIQIYKTVIAFFIKKPTCRSPNLFWNQVHKYFKLLSCLHEVNTVYEGIVACNQFYIPEVTSAFDLTAAHFEWMSGKHELPNICQFPFVFDAQAKVILLECDAAIQMMNAVGQSAIQHCMMNRHCSEAETYLILAVRRDQLLADTLSQLIRQIDSNLKRPLKIKFIGEEAMDEGGVRKEFFLLLIKELLNPNYGMFIRTPITSILWFSEDTWEDVLMFFLVGIVCGLAIYNFTIIDLPFPLVLYKKLLGRKTRLDDLYGLFPDMVQSFKCMLEDDSEDFEDTYDLTFEITRSGFGKTVTHELKPGGKLIAVNQCNKQEYVDLYVDYILDKSVEKQYHKFHEGLHKVCGGKILNLFQPEELMEMILGSDNYDWQEFEKNACYKNGFSANHRVVRWFWNVFHSLDQNGKKMFLTFVSGSDRIPISGMRDVKICIQPLKVSPEYLPIAHTCFNLLDLPEYTSEEALRMKLLQAIENPEGFGFV